MSPWQPVAWMVYTQDGQSCYVTDNPADVSPDQRALPLYTQPFPTDEALLHQALRALEYVRATPEGDWLARQQEGAIIDWVIEALRERLGSER